MNREHEAEPVTEKLRQTRERLEREIIERHASFDVRDTLEKLNESRTHSDDLDDTLIQHGQA